MPALKKGKKWYQIADTESILEEAGCLQDQKKIEVKPRTIILLKSR